ncbi:MAG: hypothetical protein J7605_10300 [Variovorax sp.]|nr:hypothetical protein [Variovorax sp.]
MNHFIAIAEAALRYALRGGYVLSVAAVLTACGTPPPSDFSGDWLPVNRYQEATAEIPLSPTYVFQATPIDGTLKTMLERWAVDSDLKLNYRLGSDYTLHQPVSRIRTADIRAAASELSAIYAPRGVSVTANDRVILVQPAEATQPVPAN